jgi:hypothetical protein
VPPLTRVTVNSHVLRSNNTHGLDEPPLALRSGGTVEYAHELVIYGQDGLEAARVVYDGVKTLSCGARTWVETRGVVESVLREA